MNSVPFRNVSVPGGNTIAGNTTETAFNSQTTILANSLSLGNAYRVTGRGNYTTGTLATSITLKVKLGSTVLASSSFNSVTLSQTQMAFRIQIQLIVYSIGATGQVEAQGEVSLITSTNTVQMAGLINIAPVTVDTTVDNILSVTAQFGGLGASTASIQLRTLFVEEIV